MDVYMQVKKLYESFHGEKRIIGKSSLGRNIYALKIGAGKPVGLVQYAIHGREFITAYLAKEHIRVGVYKGSLWLIPLVNPDGALLSQTGIESIQNIKKRNKLIALNGGNSDFSLWKANARGVDLNVNFDAAWGTGTKNVTWAGAENYIGKKPFSESETRALKCFTQKIKANYTVSYHTKGEEIYWYFHQQNKELLRDKRLAGVISETTGYPIGNAIGSAGGYKDWCIQSLHIPAFTIEAGADELFHPIREKDYADIAKKNRFVLYELSKVF